MKEIETDNRLDFTCNSAKIRINRILAKKEGVKLKKQLAFSKIMFSLLGFVILWTVVTDAWGYSDFIFGFENGKYLYGYISRIVWVLPALILIILCNDFLWINKHELFSYPKLDKSFIIALTVSIVSVLISMLAGHKGLWINTEINFGLTLIKYVIVGFVEESVFRGWGFNALMKVSTYKKAAVFSTIMFIVLHWPAYFIKYLRFGTFDFAGILYQSFSALIWGLIFCWLLKKGKSLWKPIFVHAFYDFLMIMFVG